MESLTPPVHLSVKSNGTRPVDTEIRLSDGKSLGLVQSIKWEIAVGDPGGRCTIETLLTPAELDILASDVTVKYQLIEHPNICPGAPTPSTK